MDQNIEIISIENNEMFFEINNMKNSRFNIETKECVRY
jgi:hypothetical protein